MRHPKAKGKFVFIVKRGVCTYSSKAYQGNLAEALAVLVVHDEPGYQVENTIPYEDSFYKHVKTPVILINNSQGEMILESLKSQEVFMIFKNDLEGNATTNVRLEYWIGPYNHKAYKVLV